MLDLFSYCILHSPFIQRTVHPVKRKLLVLIPSLILFVAVFTFLLRFSPRQYLQFDIAIGIAFCYAGQARFESSSSKQLCRAVHWLSHKRQILLITTKIWARAGVSTPSLPGSSLFLPRESTVTCLLYFCRFKRCDWREGGAGKLRGCPRKNG